MGAATHRALARFTPAILLLASHSLADAQVRCTMPNGVVIEQKLASTCPVGATKGETFDGEVVPLRLPDPPTPPAEKKPPKKEAATAPPPKPPASTEFDRAQALCHQLTSTNLATQCKTAGGIFAGYKLDVTSNATPVMAARICQQIRGGGWGLRDWDMLFFSPYGAGNRPFHSCRL
jgi:hypothetical protein